MTDDRDDLLARAHRMLAARGMLEISLAHEVLREIERLTFEMKAARVEVGIADAEIERLRAGKKMDDPFAHVALPMTARGWATEILMRLQVEVPLRDRAGLTVQDILTIGIERAIKDAVFRQQQARADACKQPG